MPINSPSNDFIDTLRFGALLVVGKFVVYEYTPSGSVLQTYHLPVSSANVTNDRNAAIRRSGQVTVELVPSVPPPPLLPTIPSATQPLGPFGNEVSVSFGLATSKAYSGPVCVTTAAAAQNATSVEVIDLSGDGLRFEMGDTICFNGSSPSTVVTIASLGSNLYEVGIVEPLVSNVPVGAAVQLVEFVSMGLFTTTTTVVDATAPTLTVTLDVSDRAFVLSARETTAPYKFPSTASGTFEDEVTLLLNEAWGSYPSLPALQYNFSEANNPVVPIGRYGQGSSPWQMALDLASVAGNELYIDENGVVTAHRYPDVKTKAVSWYFTQDTSSVYANPANPITSGSPYTVPIGVQVTFTRDGIFNDVYITGSGTQNAPGASGSASTTNGSGTSGTSTTAASPVLGHAADNTVASATYVDGPLGDLPEFVSSNLLPTASQAAAMASLDLAMSISSAWQVEITVQPNPLVDVDDVISVNYPSVGLNGPDGQGLCVVVDTVTTGVKYAETTTITGRVIPGRYA